MLKNILKIAAIFIIGMVGGIFAEEIFWPYFIERPLFYQYKLERRPIYLTETKEVVIRENTALKDAIEKTGKSVVGIRTRISGNRFLEGSGLILTSDGLMITLAELIPIGSTPDLFLEEKQVSFQVLKRDSKENLALIKLEGSSFTTTGFTSLERLKIGERVFLLGATFEQGQTLRIKRVANEGIVRAFDDNFIQTSIFEKSNLAGSPLFDIEGNVLGLNTVDRAGRVNAISIKKIRDFTGI